VRILLKQILACVALLAAVLFAVDRLSMLYGPDNAILDTDKACMFGERKSEMDGHYFPNDISIFQNRWEAALLGSYILGLSERPKMIFFGGSSTEEGFRPADLQPLLPDFEVHSVCITGGALPDLRDVIRTTLATMQPAAVPKSVFVIGLYHSIYQGDGADSIVRKYQNEMYPGIFPAAQSGKDPVLSDRQFARLMRLARPFYWIQFQALHAKEKVDRALRLAKKTKGVFPAMSTFCSYVANKQPDPVLEEKNYDWAKSIPAMVRYWNEGSFIRSANKNISPVQIAVLEDMVRMIQARGGQVVLVDLPVSSIHRDVFVNGQAYQKMRAGLYSRLVATYGVQYIGMQSEFADGTFADSVHPGTGWRAQWSRSFAHHYTRLLQH